MKFDLLTGSQEIKLLSLLAMVSFNLKIIIDHDHENTIFFATFSINGPLQMRTGGSDPGHFVFVSIFTPKLACWYSKVLTGRKYQLLSTSSNLK